MQILLKFRGRSTYIECFLAHKLWNSLSYLGTSWQVLVLEFFLSDNLNSLKTDVSETFFYTYVKSYPS